MAEPRPPSTRLVAQRPSMPSTEVDCYAHFAVCRFEDGRPDVLGSGGMGTTYRAFDLQLQRPVALKTINPQHVYDPEARARFLREARAAARIQHPHVAGVLYQGEERDTCFYVMELVTGESLAEYVVRSGTIDPVTALGLAHQVALALDAAHREQVLHRDLKPGNIMLTRYHDQRQWHVKVIDFGLAKLLQEGAASFATLPGFLGTPGFASPEQCDEKPLDARSDLYSLGATLWFMLSGGPPFLGTALSVIKAHVATEPDYESLAGCPAPVVALLRRLLAKNPDDRPTTALEAADEIARTLEQIGNNGSSAPPPPGDAPLAHPGRSRARFAWALLVVGLGVLAGGFWWASQRGVRPESGPVVVAPPAAAPVSSLPVRPDKEKAPSAPDEKTVAATVPAPAVEPPAKEFTNSLGMKFRPLGILPGLLSVWETRVKDYRAFATATGLPEATGKADWNHPGFEQGTDHPVVWVSLADADRFCRWLTKHERDAGAIKVTQYYRLPTRLEFDAACGRVPPELRQKMAGDAASAPPASGPEGPYPWGMAWPPPSGAGNFADQSAQTAGAVARGIPGYDDGWPRTSPVGSFPTKGFPDLTGNVWEWVVTRPGTLEGGRQGGGWMSYGEDDFRFHSMTRLDAAQSAADLGFRCILADENDPKPPVPDRGGRAEPPAQAPSDR